MSGVAAVAVVAAVVAVSSPGAIDVVIDSTSIMSLSFKTSFSAVSFGSMLVPLFMKRTCEKCSPMWRQYALIR